MHIEKRLIGTGDEIADIIKEKYGSSDMKLYIPNVWHEEDVVGGIESLGEEYREQFMAMTEDEQDVVIDTIMVESVDNFSAETGYGWDELRNIARGVITLDNED